MFLEKQHNNRIQNEGFFRVNLLDKDEVSRLTTFFQDQYPKQDAGFHSTHFLQDRRLKKETHELIVRVLKDRLSQLIPAYYPLFANFMIKFPGEESRMPLHADWTYVDEPKSRSFGVWSPLTDTNAKNGMLGVVPYSQNLAINKRGPKIPTPFHDFNEYIIKNYGELQAMKAGEALIYDHRLLHFSPANLMNKERVAINVVLVPQDVAIYHYANRGAYPELEKYQVRSSDFYINYDHFQRPDSSVIPDIVEGRINCFSKKYIDRVLTNHRPWWRFF